jgi:hypothetical protein
MGETILIGRGREMSEVPREEWERELAQAPERVAVRLEFMSHHHHRVRYYVVRELPATGGPIPAEQISRELGLPLQRVREIIGDLERHLFFLVTRDEGAVSWAFPVTTADTGHHLVFGTGERLDAA